MAKSKTVSTDIQKKEVTVEIQYASNVIVFLEQVIGSFEHEGKKGEITISPKGYHMHFEGTVYTLTMNNFINPVMNDIILAK